jgi:uncharacterized membrane protein YhfC
MSGGGVFLRLLNGLLMVAIPCLVALFILRRRGGGFRPIWIGVAGFVLSQVGHIPFNRFLLLPGLERWGIDLSARAGSDLVVLGLAVGLSAGIFEELVRYLAFRFWLKDEGGAVLPWKYGVGHGGIEAVLTGVLALYALVQVAALSGEGVLVDFPADQAGLIRSQVEAYWALPWYQSLLGAWERISALGFHLGASVFVYKSYREKKPLWFLVALLGHAALNAFAVIAAVKMDLVLLELLLFIFAIGWVFWAWFVRPEEEKKAGLAPPPPELELTVSEITSNQIEESRYD